MRNSQRGEVITAITIGAFLLVSAVALVSSMVANKTPQTTTSQAAGIQCSDYPSEPVPPNPAATTNNPGYYWKSPDHCSLTCSSNSQCPKNTSDPVHIFPDSSAWCYGYNGVGKCMQLQYGVLPGGQQPTLPPQSTPTPIIYVPQECYSDVNIYYDRTNHLCVIGSQDPNGKGCGLRSSGNSNGTPRSCTYIPQGQPNGSYTIGGVSYNVFRCDDSGMDQVAGLNYSIINRCLNYWNEGRFNNWVNINNAQSPPRQQNPPTQTPIPTPTQGSVQQPPGNPPPGNPPPGNQPPPTCTNGDTSCANGNLSICRNGNYVFDHQCPNPPKSCASSNACNSQSQAPQPNCPSLGKGCHVWNAGKYYYCLTSNASEVATGPFSRVRDCTDDYEDAVKAKNSGAGAGNCKIEKTNENKSNGDKYCEDNVVKQCITNSEVNAKFCNADQVCETRNNVTDCYPKTDTPANQPYCFDYAGNRQTVNSRYCKGGDVIECTASGEKMADNCHGYVDNMLCGYKGNSQTPACWIHPDPQITFPVPPPAPCVQNKCRDENQLVPYWSKQLSSTVKKNYTDDHCVNELRTPGTQIEGFNSNDPENTYGGRGDSWCDAQMREVSYKIVVHITGDNIYLVNHRDTTFQLYLGMDNGVQGNSDTWRHFGGWNLPPYNPQSSSPIITSKLITIDHSQYTNYAVSKYYAWLCYYKFSVPTCISSIPYAYPSTSDNLIELNVNLNGS